MNALGILQRALAIGPAASTITFGPVLGQEKVLKVVMHSDLKSLDPVWSGAYIVREHGHLIYDTLFAMDASYQVRPQMAEFLRMSEDGLTATIRLREGSPGTTASR
jgi:peptide/nickel transport system substrate-binding protein